MKNHKPFIYQLSVVLDTAKKEQSIILDGKASQWNLTQIEDVIIPEVNELLSRANNGIVYFKFGKHQRFLESSYLITDSLENLSHTILGKSILHLQRLYDSL